MIGNLYFIQEGLAGPVKIGFTAADPLDRLRTFQVGNSSELRLIATLPAYPDAEKFWHRAMRAHWLRNEWFSPHSDLFVAIEAAKAEGLPVRAATGRPQSLQQLRKWLDQNEISNAEFARRLGYSSSYVGELLNHTWSFLSPRMASRIEQVTEGRFSAIGLLLGVDNTRARRAVARAQRIERQAVSA